MSERIRHPAPTSIRQVFYEGNELRAIWSLCLFAMLVLSALYAGDSMARHFLRGAGLATLFFVREIRILLTFFFATWVMARIEGQSIAEYGLPWRSMFGCRFWIGALLGFASLTCLLLAMRLIRRFPFRSGRSARYGHREVGADLCAGVRLGRLDGRIQRSRVCALHAYEDYHILASRNYDGHRLRLLSYSQFRGGLDRIIQRWPVRPASLSVASQNRGSVDAHWLPHGVRLG